MNAHKKDTAIKSGREVTNQEEIPVEAAATNSQSITPEKDPDSLAHRAEKLDFCRRVWSDTLCVGMGYSIQLALSNGLHLDCKWTPDIPHGSMSRKILEMVLYHRARDQFILDISKSRAVTIFTVEA